MHKVARIRLLTVISVFSLLLFYCEEGEPRGENPLSCNERANFPDSSQSEYVLPFPPGKSYILSQSYCNPHGGHKNQLAYDFALSIGDSVCAIQTGKVKEAKWDQPDTRGAITASNHNYIMIEHEDGSVAFYAHLKQDGVLVRVGDNIKRGQIIALSGNSGNTLNFPQLHIGLYEDYPAVETYDLPITFINVEGTFDEKGGLISDLLYKAIDY